MLARCRPDLLIFFGVFCFSLFVQTQAWHVNKPLDGDVWAEAIASTAEHFFIHPSPGNPTDPYGHPATPLLLLGGMFVHFGMSSTEALKLVLAFLTSLGIALAVLMTYSLRPKSLWWLGSAGLLIFDGLYYSATPPSSIILPWIALLALLVLRIVEEGGDTRTLALLGIVGGFSLATRIDISLAFLGTSFLLLLLYIKRGVWIFVFSTLLAFAFFDPYVWALPVEHVTAIVARILNAYTVTYRDSLDFIVLASPFALLSIFFGLLLGVLRKDLLPVPRVFLLWLLGTCLAVAGILLASPSFHPLWYFYPLFFAWEIFLPLFLLAPLENFESQPELPWLTKFRLETSLITLLIAAQVFLFVNFVLPI